jgi:hypothetical protein
MIRASNAPTRKGNPRDMSSCNTPQLFHVCEESLPSGSIIRPGRWGALVLNGGANEPFFFREHLLEIWRREKTTVVVSRLACTFAWETQEQAEHWASQHEFILRVRPVDPNAPRARLDILWLTWMSEPDATTDKIMQWCAAYWAGRATTDLMPSATASWEWLFACPLRVE